MQTTTVPCPQPVSLHYITYVNHMLSFVSGPLSSSLSRSSLSLPSRANASLARFFLRFSQNSHTHVPTAHSRVPIWNAMSVISASRYSGGLDIGPNIHTESVELKFVAVTIRPIATEQRVSGAELFATHVLSGTTPPIAPGTERKSEPYRTLFEFDPARA